MDREELARLLRSTFVEELARQLETLDGGLVELEAAIGTSAEPSLLRDAIDELMR